MKMKIMISQFLLQVPVPLSTVLQITCLQAHVDGVVVMVFGVEYLKKFQGMYNDESIDMIGGYQVMSANIDY